MLRAIDSFLIIAAALAIVFATTTAATVQHRAWSRQKGWAYDAQGNPNYGFGPLVPVQPGDVIAGGSIIGRDPDPFIRNQLLRDYHSGWPD